MFQEFGTYNWSSGKISSKLKPIHLHKPVFRATSKQRFNAWIISWHCSLIFSISCEDQININDVFQKWKIEFASHLILILCFYFKIRRREAHTKKCISLQIACQNTYHSYIFKEHGKLSSQNCKFKHSQLNYLIWKY